MKKYICLALSFSPLTAAVSETATQPRPFTVTCIKKNTRENLPPPILDLRLSEENYDTQFIAPLPLAERKINMPPRLQYKEGMKAQGLLDLVPLPPPIPFGLPGAVLNYPPQKTVFRVTNTKTNKSEEFAGLSAMRPSTSDLSAEKNKEREIGFYFDPSLQVAKN